MRPGYAALAAGEVASADGDRYMREITGGRLRRCHCGCGGKATHAGASNGLSLMAGCELSVRRWVRDPQDVYRMASERTAAGVEIKVLLRNDVSEGWRWTVVRRRGLGPHTTRRGTAGSEGEALIAAGAAMAEMASADAPVASGVLGSVGALPSH